MYFFTFKLGYKLYDSYPPVIHFGVQTGPLVLEQGQVLLGLGGSWTSLLSTSGQQHGLTLIQKPVVLLCTLDQLVLQLLQLGMMD